MVAQPQHPFSVFSGQSVFLHSLLNALGSRRKSAGKSHQKQAGASPGKGNQLFKTFGYVPQGQILSHQSGQYKHGEQTWHHGLQAYFYGLSGAFCPTAAVQNQTGHSQQQSSRKKRIGFAFHYGSPL